MIVTNNAELEVFKEKSQQSTLLVPLVDEVNKDLGLSIAKIVINLVHEDKYTATSEYWSPDSEKYFLTKVSLDKIATAAGVRFSDSQICIREVDKDKKPVYVKHKVKFEYLGSDGHTVSSVVTGEYSYHEEINLIRYRNDVYVDGKLIHVAGSKNFELINIRRSNAGSVAEANAKRKALQEIFPRLKKPFSFQELNCPIYVGKFIYNTEKILQENPEFKDAYIAKMLDLGNSFYPSFSCQINKTNIIKSDPAINPFERVKSQKMILLNISDHQDEKNRFSENQTSNGVNS